MSKLNNVNYVIDNYDADLILADSLWMMPGEEVNDEGKRAFIIKRGLHIGASKGLLWRNQRAGQDFII